MKRIYSLIVLVLAAVMALQAQQVKEISQAQFATAIGNYTSGLAMVKNKGTRPAVVDFNATWCGPCRRLAPELEALAKEYKGRVDFYSIDIDKNKAIAKAFGIQSIPYVVFIPLKGQPQSIMGYYPKADIKEVIQHTFKLK